MPIEDGCRFAGSGRRLSSERPRPEWRRLRTEAEAISRLAGHAIPQCPKSQKKYDEEDRRYKCGQRHCVGRWREGVAGVFAAFHVLGSKVVLDPVGDHAELDDQEQKRNQAHQRQPHHRRLRAPTGHHMPLPAILRESHVPRHYGSGIHDRPMPYPLHCTKSIRRPPPFRGV